MPSNRPREGDAAPLGEVARDRGGVEVEANRERIDVLGRRNGSEPRELVELEVEGASCVRVLEMSREDPRAMAGGLRIVSPSSEVMSVGGMGDRGRY